MENNTANNLWKSAQLSQWVALDLETTGLDPNECEIIELGAVRFEDGIEVDRFSQLVKPTVKSLPHEIVKLTGISDDDLRTAPSLDEMAQPFIDFVGDYPIIGHHVSFDLGFLKSAPQFQIDPTGISKKTSHFDSNQLIGRVHDTNLIARFLLPCIDSYGLKYLATRYKTPTPPNHRAVDDAAATSELFAAMMQDMSAVPFKQISQGIRFVEGTSSPLANSLRAIHQAISSGYHTSKNAPDPLTGQPQGRNNIYKAEGDARPTKPIPQRQVYRFFQETDRFIKLMPDYEIRPQQANMAVKVAEAFESNSILMVEAGTGVGKSLGYLVPALLSGDRVVLSTHTKNLQDQLFYDEIPRLGKLFKFGFTAALLKGRRNYLCHTKWRQWANNPSRIQAPMLREKAALVVRWVDATQTGDIGEISCIRSENRDSFYMQIVSEAGYCTGRICKGMNCPLPRIRQAAQKADLVVVNHSLVLSDLRGEASLLGEVSKIVFDEAHHIEDVATDQYGTDLIAPAVKNTLERIGRVCKRNGELWTTLSITGDNLPRSVEKIAADVADLSPSVDQLFKQLFILFSDNRKEDTPYSTPVRYNNSASIHQQLYQSGQPLLSGLKGLSSNLTSLLKDIEDIKENFQDINESVSVMELQTATGELSDLTNDLKLSIEADEDNRVYWTDLPPELNRPIRLMSAPLDVAEILKVGLWDRLGSVILTSATLSTNNSPNGFKHISERLGLNLIEKDFMTATFGSPFDYEKNCLVCFPTFVPSPAEDPSGHTKAVADIVSQLSKKFRLGTLMLFTSYNGMRFTRRLLEKSLAGTGLDILVQGGAGQRERLVRRLRHSKGALLLGTNSLWEGIDVPGDALQVVVVPRLPFAVPDDPIVATRIEKIRDDGGNPFYEYQIPSAALRLRQGTGRLIRSMTDRGVVLILDSRTVSKGYGSKFRQAVHGTQIMPKDFKELETCITEFIEC